MGGSGSVVLAVVPSSSAIALTLGGLLVDTSTYSGRGGYKVWKMPNIWHFSTSPGRDICTSVSSVKRNRPQTEQRIIDAAIGLIADAGFTDFGVNHIAARAGIDKVLIYRYFGGVEGLLEHIGQHHEFFPEPHKVIEGTLADFIEAYRLAMTADRLASALLDWERLTENPLTLAFQRQRRSFWDDVRDQMRPNPETNVLFDLMSALPVNAFSAELLAPLLDVLSGGSTQSATMKKVKADAVPEPEAAPQSEPDPEEHLPDNLL